MLRVTWHGRFADWTGGGSWTRSWDNPHFHRQASLCKKQYTEELPAFVPHIATDQ